MCRPEDIKIKIKIKPEFASGSTTDGIRGYFFISFVSLYIYFSILETLKEKKLSQKISVKDALFELSKIYVIADGARRSVAEVPERSQKIADAFGLMLYPKIVRS